MNRQRTTKLSLLLGCCSLLLMQLSLESLPFMPAIAAPLTWTHLSTTSGDLPLPDNITQQTSALILDIDRDGINDFVIASRREPGPSLMWYRRANGGWTNYVIDSMVLPIEAGGAYADIDGDGDLDLVMGADSADNKVWWWENPYPAYDPTTGWTRRLIKDAGGAKHHDQMFGDFDGDGALELVFWNQYALALHLAEIPTDPRTTQPWPFTPIYTWASGAEHEGLAQADIDGDGKTDIVGGGRWFKHNGGADYTANLIDDAMRFTRAAAGQLIAGGRPEVVFGCGDCDGPLKLYTWNGSSWDGRDLLGFNVEHGHSLALADINRDGWLDIFVAEMRLDGGNPDAKLWILEGDGAGNFVRTEVATGYGNHESKVGDLDGDGDLDILGKPFNWETPRLDVWLNGGTCTPSLDSWQRHVIDANKPWRSLFIQTADLDGDHLQDVVTGGWWYKNPGVPGGTWQRDTIGASLNNMAALYDFDGDGDVDIFGAQGQGDQMNPAFVWARNGGAGNFTIFNNITQGNGNFLQGVAVARFQPTGALEVALSWHDASQGVQMLTVPDAPATTPWSWRQLSPTAQGEALSAADIDRDSDLDLNLGTIWLRNEGQAGAQALAWTPFTLHSSVEPDRNHLADINQDGRLDSVVGFESANTPAKLAWYEQPTTPTSNWIEHIIATTAIAPMSLDVKDMDQDGDLDVVAGEHNLENPASAKLYIFENTDGNGNQWTAHIVYTGDEHHDGAQVVDLDNDGDFDIVSIGWGHSRVTAYENKTTTCATATPTATSMATTTATTTLTTAPTPAHTVVSTATLTTTVTPITTPTPTATTTPTPSTGPITVKPQASPDAAKLYLPLVGQ